MSTEALLKARDDDDSNEVFEIIDYTVASSWERFLASLENVLQNWASSTEKSLGPHPSWRPNEPVMFQDRIFKLEYFVCSRDDAKTQTRRLTFSSENQERAYDSLPSLLQEMMDPRADFRPTGHYLNRWLGIDRVIVLSPLDHATLSPNEVKLLLGSLCIALYNAECHLPCILPVGNPSRLLYQGTALHDQVRLRIYGHQFSAAPDTLTTLGDLKAHFAMKLSTEDGQHAADKTSVEAAACYSFSFANCNWGAWRTGQQYARSRQSVLQTGEEKRERDVVSTEPFTDMSNSVCDLASDSAFGLVYKLAALPWGPEIDPLRNLTLEVSWPDTPYNHALDSLHPLLESELMDATIWTLFPEFDSQPDLPLSDLVGALMQLFVKASSSPKALSSLSSRTAGSFLASITLPSSGNVFCTDALLDVKYLDRVIRSLFDPTGWCSNDAPSSVGDLRLSQFVNLRSGKIAPEGSVLWLISRHILKETRNSVSASLKGLAMLWSAFLKELRWHWENQVTIKCIGPGAPDFRFCLLHQKLQMLNCCIDHRRKHKESNSSSLKLPSLTEIFDRLQSKTRRTPPATPLSGSQDDLQIGRKAPSAESGSSGSSTPRRTVSAVLQTQGSPAMDTPSDPSSPLNGSFYGGDGQCDELSTIRSYVQVEAPAGAPAEFDAAMAEGRLGRFRDLTLLNREEPIFEPVSQDLGYMTEDMLEQQQEVFAKLGTSADAAKLRARLQSAQVLSGTFDYFLVLSAELMIFLQIWRRSRLRIPERAWRILCGGIPRVTGSLRKAKPPACSVSACRRVAIYGESFGKALSLCLR